MEGLYDAVTSLALFSSSSHPTPLLQGTIYCIIPHTQTYNLFSFCLWTPTHETFALSCKKQTFWQVNIQACESVSLLIIPCDQPQLWQSIVTVNRWEILHWGGRPTLKIGSIISLPSRTKERPEKLSVCTYVSLPPDYGSNVVNYLETRRHVIMV